MRNFIIKSSIILLFSATLFSCIPSKSSESNTLKVVSWNIWHGGHSKEYPNKGCQGVKSILKATEADVILMIETYGSSAQIADTLGYYHRLISNNLSIYSRYPIIETYTFKDSISNFNFGGVMINKDGQKIRVFDTWIHYLPDTSLVPTDSTETQIIEWENIGTRDDEIKTILNVIKPYIYESDYIPIIMGGDFNSHSHLDWTEATKDLYNHGGKTVNWTVSNLMADAGFKDSYREINPDPATSLGETWLWCVEGMLRKDRIDYIYYQGSSIQVISSQAHPGIMGKNYKYNGNEYFYASDHGFVETIFKIKN